MSDAHDHDPPGDAVAEGAQARIRGRPKEACPYPADSRERTDWLAGYDGKPPGRPTDAPAEGV